MAERSASRYPSERLPLGEGGRERTPRSAGLFMAAFLAGALLLSLVNPALFESPQASILDGSWAAAYQQAFETESPLFEPATTVWGAIEYSLFSQGRPGLLVGANDWLFTSEEFAYPARETRAAETMASNLDQVAVVRELLASQGIELLVALLPAKARIYPEQLGRYRLPEGPERRYDQALAGLEDRGVAVADIGAALEEAKGNGQVFLRTDTHWTPFGASVAAAVVAERAASLDQFDWFGGTRFATARGETEPYRGDLTRYIPLGPLYEAIGPEDDLLTQVTTRSTGGVGTDLFAAVEIPVVLVGTSYSQDERWNFPGYLREELGSDVLVAAQEGRGPFEPMLEYLDGEALETSPPDLVVWEIPERYLSEPWQAGEETQ